MWAIACPPLLSACLSYPPLSFPAISWHVLSYPWSWPVSTFPNHLLLKIPRLFSAFRTFWLPFCLSASSYWLKVSNFLSAFSSTDSLLSTLFFSRFLSSQISLSFLPQSFFGVLLPFCIKCTSYLPADRSLPLCLQVTHFLSACNPACRSVISACRSITFCLHAAFLLPFCLPVYFFYAWVPSCSCCM